MILHLSEIGSGEENLAPSPELTPAEISAVLSNYKLRDDSDLVRRVQRYLNSLSKWNSHINLTAIQDPLEILRILMAESFFAAELVRQPEGPILDIGSGAGFPGLAMALYQPELEVILLEPRKKRAAFLLALRRELGLTRVTVRNRRLEECSAIDFLSLPSVLTMRAVGSIAQLVGEGARFLSGARKLLLFSSVMSAAGTMDGLHDVAWLPPTPVPWNPSHVILLGQIKNVPRETLS